MLSVHDLAMLAAVAFFLLAAFGVYAKVGWQALGWAALAVMLGVGR